MAALAALRNPVVYFCYCCGTGVAGGSASLLSSGRGQQLVLE
jgi:hypothetical protein